MTVGAVSTRSTSGEPVMRGPPPAGRRRSGPAPRRHARRRRTTPRSRGRQVHAGVQHRVEEAGVGGASPAAARRRSSSTWPSREEDREQCPAACSRCGTPASLSAAPIAACTAADGGVEMLVHGVVRRAEGGQAGRGGDRVPGQRAGLVHRPERAPEVHDVGPPAESADRQAAADHLAERQQVRARPALGRPAVQPAHAGRLTRKPVITSSVISSAPCVGRIRRRRGVEARAAAGPRPCSPARPR